MTKCDRSVGMVISQNWLRNVLSRVIGMRTTDALLCTLRGRCTLSTKKRVQF